MRGLPKHLCVVDIGSLHITQVFNNNKKTLKKGKVLQVVLTDCFSLLSLLTYFYGFWFVFVFTVTTASMMVHAPPCSPAPPGWQIQMCRCKKVSQHSLKNVEEMDHTSRTGIYASVQGSKGGALAESSTMTSDGLLEHFSDRLHGARESSTSHVL